MSRNNILIIIGVIVVLVAAFAVFNPLHITSTSSSTSDTLTFANGALNIQGEKFNIPDGYDENGSEIGIQSNVTANARETYDTFTNGNNTIIVKVFYFDDGNFENLTSDHTDAENKTINNINGFLSSENDQVIFNYISNGKLIEIIAPNENILSSIISANK